QELCDLLCVGVVLFDSDGECFDAAVEEEGSVGVEAAAQMVEPVGYLLDQFGRAYYGAGDDVRVAVEIFRGAVQGEVEAVLRRTIVDGAGEGVVNDADEVVGSGERDDSVQVRNPHQRVGDCFDVDGLGCQP